MVQARKHCFRVTRFTTRGTDGDTREKGENIRYDAEDATVGHEGVTKRMKRDSANQRHYINVIDVKPCRRRRPFTAMQHIYRYRLPWFLHSGCFSWNLRAPRSRLDRVSIISTTSDSPTVPPRRISIFRRRFHDTPIEELILLRGGFDKNTRSRSTGNRRSRERQGPWINAKGFQDVGFNGVLREFENEVAGDSRDWW